MLIERFFTPELAQVAYAVGDKSVGDVAIIDPRRDVGEYIDWARRSSLRIVATLETHVHADFVSGAVELAAATGAPIYASRLGEQDFDHTPVDDGFSLDIGSVRLTAIHTPGHTPEHIAWRADDTTDANIEPVLFSGDALFVGDVGRPDLLGSDRTDELVDRLYETVTTVFKRLPGDMVVYPGHTAGSSCGKKIGDDPNTTIGREKAMNYAFRPESREAFADAVMGGMPQPPAYYLVLKKVNKVGAEPLVELPSVPTLSLEAVEDALASGTMVIDVRSTEAFAEGHIPGTVFVGADSSFSTWMGWLAPYDRDLVLIADDAAQAREAQTMLRRIGLDRIAGYHVGVNAWRVSGRPLETLESVAAGGVIDELKRGTKMTILDVRGADEYEMGHIDGASHHWLARIARGDLPDLDPADPITLVCQSGYRSTIAASLLRARGFNRLRNIAGGMDAWEAARDETRSIA
jgi:hydroxyacylglutathione hydrolase